MDAQAPIEDWVDLWFGRMPRVDGPAEMVGPLLRQNSLVTEPWHDGDVDVLVCENQGVWLWGRASDGRLVERENDRGFPWTPTGEDEEQFWLHLAAFEALMQMPAARCAQLVEPTHLTRLEAMSHPLPCGTWRWPGCQRLRYREATIVTVSIDEQGDVEVTAGGQSERELSWIDGLGIDWNIVDSRTG